MTWIHNLNPVILDFGALEIRWYGVMYVLAFLITYYYGVWRIKNKKSILSLEDFDSLLVWATAGLIIGARVFNTFYYLEEYLAKPWEILFFWQGGLSFFGGLVGMAVAVWIFNNKKIFSYLHLADLLVVPLSIGQGLGRIGNFINGELWGTITNLPWGIQFPGISGFRHPTQLYELIYNIIIFAVLWKLKDKLKTGQLFALFLILYSIFRFFTEFLRGEIEVWIGPLTLSQAFCIPMLIAGIILWKRLSKQDNNLE